MRLVYQKTHEPVKIGDEVELQGEGRYRVRAIIKPHKPASTGRVYVVDENESGCEFFPSVIGAEWIEREDHD